MELTSNVFANEEKIPKKYSCEGDSVSPPLEISEAPEDTKSFALIVLDIDVPEEFQKKLNIKNWDQLVLFNISSTTTEIPEGDGNSVGVHGNNTSGKASYDPICPPSKHRYVFTIYALDVDKLDLEEGASRADLEKAMEGHVLEKAELMGVYEKEN